MNSNKIMWIWIKIRSKKYIYQAKDLFKILYTPRCESAQNNIDPAGRRSAKPAPTAGFRTLGP